MDVETDVDLFSCRLLEGDIEQKIATHDRTHNDVRILCSDGEREREQEHLVSVFFVSVVIAIAIAIIILIIIVIIIIVVVK